MEIDAARALGRRAGERYLELRYEDLVADPAGELMRICEFASLPWEPAMVEYAGKVDVSKLNAVQTRGTLKTGTVLIGLRASASAARATAAGTASAGFSDSTRGGGTFTMGSCQP